VAALVLEEGKKTNPVGEIHMKLTTTKKRRREKMK
jgi:hypothetical protein